MVHPYQHSNQRYDSDGRPEEERAEAGLMIAKYVNAIKTPAAPTCKNPW
jgi:hypothetical protein